MSGILGAGANATGHSILNPGASWGQIAEAGVLGFFAGSATAGFGLPAIAAKAAGWAAQADGQVVRGRTKVIGMLQAIGIPGPPASVELRDRQVYRWYV